MSYLILIIVSKIAMSSILILLMCKICGALFSYIGQPRVVGEITAGIILGPSILPSIFNIDISYLFTGEVKQWLQILSNVGIGIYMFSMGLKVNSKPLSHNFKKDSISLALFGLVPALLLGSIVGIITYSSLANERINLYVFSFFIAIALSITAFPVLSRIVDEATLTNTYLGRIVLVAASIEDCIAWVLMATLTIIINFYNYGQVLIVVLGLILIAFLLKVPYKYIFNIMDNLVESKKKTPKYYIIIVLFAVLSTVAITDYIGLHAAIGGFLVGLIAPRSSLFVKEIKVSIIDRNNKFLMPLFFAYTGINTHLNIIFSTKELIYSFLLITSVGVFGKFLGCILFSRINKYSWKESIVISILMNTRGTMLMLMATVGLKMNIITLEAFSILVAVAVFTTIIALPIIKICTKIKSEKESLLEITS
ncbi:cation:proton antiporter [Priestia megaterium]|uniref:cation:proton antiporter n=1 Tax=Priestia megaterium TaxID=1404 RepID=UPI0025B26A45|nr:cation:proton antiporter [Priestia megaterium]MDN3233371.1 cation:proton antiporter [Priestia megaterium]